MIRALFVNSGILGHGTVAALFRDAAALIPELNAQHINLSDNVTLPDRALRRVLSLRLAPRAGRAANLDLRRWRQELNVGLLAAKRIGRAERASQAFDLLHLHPQAVAYASCGRMWRTSTIVSIDATQEQAADETSSLTRLSYEPSVRHDRAVFRAAAAITATSRWVAASLASHYPDCAQKVHVMPYPVRSFADTTWLGERCARSRTARVQLLFMGGDFPRKGGFDLLAAWQGGCFADRADLTLVTDWPFTPRALPRGVRLVPGIRPFTPEWSALWRAADVFVMPTRHEAFGMVFQEAAAAGLPVVATRINAIPEIVRHGATGLLVAPGDGAALARAMAALVDSADLRCRLGAAALEHARGSCAMEIYAARLRKLVHTVRDQHAAGRT